MTTTTANGANGKPAAAPQPATKAEVAIFTKIPEPQTVRKTISIDDIAPSPMNPRKTFGDLGDLKKAIRDQGLIVAPLVRPTPAKKKQFEIVCGERRWRSLKELGAVQVPCDVRELTDDQALEIMLIEYVQREDIPPLEEADAFIVMRDRMKLKADEIGARVGKSKHFVEQRIKLAGLGKKAREALAAGTLKHGAALQLARVSEEKKQDELLAKMVKRTEHGYEIQALESDEARDLIFRKLRKLKSAAFDILDNKLVAAAGDCVTCPKRTSAQGEFFVDPKECEERCTDETCWQTKVTAHGKKVLELAKAQGKKVLDRKTLWSEHTGVDLAHDVPFVDLARSVWTNGAQASWKSILKDSDIEIVTAVDREGNTHEIADKRQAEALAKKHNKAPAKSSSSSSASSKKTPSKVTVKSTDDRVEDAKSSALVAAIVARAEKAQDLVIWRIIGEDTIDALGGSAQAPGREGERLGDVFKKAKTVREIAGLMLEAIALNSEPELIAKKLGLDVKSIEKKAADEEKKKIDAENAKAKASTPATTKKTSPKKSKR